MSKYVASPDQPSMSLVGGSFYPEVFKKAAWRPPDMATLPSWQGVKRLGWDLETKDQDISTLGPGVRRPGSYVVGASFAIEGGPKHYLPWAHEGGDNLDKEQCLAYLRHQFKTFDGEVVGANLPYDLDWSWELGIDMPVVRRYRDVQVSDPLLYELHNDYTLDAIGKRWGEGGKDEEGLREAARQYRLDPKKDLWRFAARHVGEYAEEDADLPLRILRKQEADIAEQGIEACWDMECRLLPVLVRMTRRGVTVNQDRLDQIDEWTKRREAEHYVLVKDATGIDIPVGHSMNVDLLTRALRAAGLEECIGANSKGESVTKDLLAASTHPVAIALTKARQVATLRTTFVNGVRRHLVNGKIHCSFNQIKKTEDDGSTSGVAYGRLSASHPNLQNQPGNSRFSGDNEIGPMWRSIYQEDWTSCDLKQQEPKWSFHFGAMMEEAGVDGVTGALELCRQLQADPTLDTYEPLVVVTGHTRPRCKVMWLARAYGKGDGEMCRDLGYDLVPWVYVPFRMKKVPVDSEEGQRAVRMEGHVIKDGPGPEGLKVIEDFDASMPFLKASATIAEKRAKQNGFVKLISQRRCHFEKSTRGYEWTHKAFNRIIQGSAAEQTKEIMLAVSDAGYDDYLNLQVHDELAFRNLSPEQAKAVADVMAHAVPMRVPTVVDIERGPSWGESMFIEYKDKSGQKKKVQYKWGMAIVDGEVVQRDGIL